MLTFRANYTNKHSNRDFSSILYKNWFLNYRGFFKTSSSESIMNEYAERLSCSFIKSKKIYLPSVKTVLFYKIKSLIMVKYLSQNTNKETLSMINITSSAAYLQPRLFASDDISTCFFSSPSEKELKFMSYRNALVSMTPYEVTRDMKMMKD